MIEFLKTNQVYTQLAPNVKSNFIRTLLSILPANTQFNKLIVHSLLLSVCGGQFYEFCVFDGFVKIKTRNRQNFLDIRHSL